MYENLKKLRESLGLTQEQFGNSVGVGKTAYNNYETGKREPRSEFWIAIAEKYHVSIDYLMGHKDDPYLIPETKKSPDSELPEPEDEVERDIINRIHRMNPAQRRALLLLLQTSEGQENKTPSSVQE